MNVRPGYDDLFAYGAIWLRGALTSQDLLDLRACAEQSHKPGTRIGLSSPLFKRLTACRFHQDILQMAKAMQLVRLVSFDKTARHNWAVPWHQDRVISVDRKTEDPSLKNWSQKAGVWHCEPDVSLLSRMLFVRVHLDDQSVSNGAMDIALGSHKEGRVDAARAEATANKYPCETTFAKAGDVLILPMLTLHRSTPALQPGGRRVLRLDYAPFQPPAPLRWAF